MFPSLLFLSSCLVLAFLSGKSRSDNSIAFGANYYRPNPLAYLDPKVPYSHWYSQMRYPSSKIQSTGNRQQGNT